MAATTQPVGRRVNNCPPQRPAWSTLSHRLTWTMLHVTIRCIGQTMHCIGLPASQHFTQGGNMANSTPTATRQDSPDTTRSTAPLVVVSSDTHIGPRVDTDLAAYCPPSF